VYGFAADITAPGDRASRMARFDGFEQTAFVVGNALSPSIYNTLGYEGAFSTKMVLAFLSLGIILKVVKNRPVIISTEGSAAKENDQGEEVKTVFDILLGMFQTLLRKRGGWLRVCIFLQIMSYAMYYICFASGRLWYLFSRKQFGWKQEEYIVLKVVRKTLGICILLLVVPCLKKLKMSDTTMLILFNVMNSAGYLLSAMAGSSLPLLYCGVILITFHYPKYALARSLLSQTVGKQEVGRIYSSLAFISAIVPLFSHLIYGHIYDNTVSTFPGAFLIFTSCLVAVAAILMILNKKLLFNSGGQDTDLHMKNVQKDQSDKLLGMENQDSGA